MKWNHSPSKRKSWTQRIALVLCAVCPTAGSPAPASDAAVKYCGSSIFEGVPPSPFGPSMRALTCKAISVRAPHARLTLALARTEPERERGLMSVRALGSHVGMIFAFTNDGARTFWMKDTLIPLDMIFLDRSGRVTSIARNVPASSVDASDDAIARRYGTGMYVIELAANEAKLAGIKPGTVLPLPGLAEIRPVN